MTDEQKYHQDSDADLLCNLAQVLRLVGERYKSNPQLAKLLWPHMMPTWCEVEAQRLLEICERWIENET